MIKEVKGKPFIFIRFFDEESHVEDFRKGFLRMLSSKYYSDYHGYIDKKFVFYDNRYDFFENASYIYNPDKDGNVDLVKPLRMGDKEYDKMWVNPKCKTSPIVVRNETLDELTKVYCFYTLIKDGPNDIKLEKCIDDLNGNFKDYYCFITNPLVLINRVKKACENYSGPSTLYSLQHGFVNYVNEELENGEYGSFKKPKGLSWQKEFRFKIICQSADPFRLPIEPIFDISFWGKVNDLKNGVIKADGRVLVDNIHT